MGLMGWFTSMGINRASSGTERSCKVSNSAVDL